MEIQAAGLSQDEDRAIARYLTSKEFSAVTQSHAGMCAAPAQKFSLVSGDWNGWGVDALNSRYQPKPGLSAAEVSKLKLKWTFGFPGDSRATAQPAVAGGRVFVGSASGAVYSLDAATGSTYWAYQAGSGVRTAISIGRLKSGRYIAYFGDLRAYAHAIDAERGTLLWKTKVEDHPAARITGAPVFHEGRLFAPVASLEEGSGPRAAVRVLHLPGQPGFTRRRNRTATVEELQRTRFRPRRRR